jgi:hypothetical protein
MFIWRLGPFKIDHARVSVSRSPQMVIKIVWTPGADERQRKDELMQGGPYEVGLPTRESWSLMPEEWQDGPDGEVTVTLRSTEPPAHGPDDSPFSLDLEAGATEAERRAVGEAFRWIGFEPGDIGRYERRSLGDHPWAIMASASLAIFLKSFLEQAGHNAADALRDFTRRIFKARESSASPKGQLVIVDEDSGLWLIIPTELPEEACRELLALDLSKLGEEHQALAYNPQTGKWELY